MRAGTYRLAKGTLLRDSVGLRGVVVEDARVAELPHGNGAYRRSTSAAKTTIAIRWTHSTSAAQLTEPFDAEENLVSLNAQAGGSRWIEVEGAEAPGALVPAGVGGACKAAKGWTLQLVHEDDWDYFAWLPAGDGGERERCDTDTLGSTRSTLTLGHAGALRGKSGDGVRTFAIMGSHGEDGPAQQLLKVRVQEAVAIDTLGSANKVMVGEHEIPVLHVSPGGEVWRAASATTAVYYHARAVEAAIHRAGGGIFWVERTGSDADADALGIPRSHGSFATRWLDSSVPPFRADADYLQLKTRPAANHAINEGAPRPVRVEEWVSAEVLKLRVGALQSVTIQGTFGFVSAADECEKQPWLETNSSGAVDQIDRAAVIDRTLQMLDAAPERGDERVRALSFLVGLLDDAAIQSLLASRRQAQRLSHMHTLCRTNTNTYVLHFVTIMQMLCSCSCGQSYHPKRPFLASSSSTGSG